VTVSSRTPEGEPHQCPICGELVATEPSAPLGDSTCPQCGSLLLAIKDGLNLRELHWNDEASKLGDSIDWVEIIMEAEEEFDIDIPEEEAQKIQTVADAIRLIRKYKNRRDEDDAQ
jgi:acyl carrier protein